jgi:DNA polymerase-3 subunit delta
VCYICFVQKENEDTQILEAYRNGDKDAFSALVHKYTPIIYNFVARAVGKRLDAGIPESTIVVIWQHEPVGKAKESKELFERLKQEKYAQEFEALTGETLTAWIKKEIATAGGTIEPGAVVAISSLGGKDMWLMSGVLAQLAAYARGRTIIASDVALFVPEKLDDNVFSLVEALVSGNRKKASLLMFEQRRLGQDDMRLFSLIAWREG